MLRGILSFVLFFVGAPATLTVAAAEEEGGHPVVLMELFTSQGCYSCPPAEELLAAEYAGGGFSPLEYYADNWDDLILASEGAPRDDVLALELHVDYWDDLIYGLAGSWEDPFSQRAFSQRQFAYNRRILGKGTGWTPQFIVHGAISAVGARKKQIDAAIAKMKESAAKDDNISWQFDGGGADGWRAEVSGALEPGAELYYAVFLRQAITEVPSGENKGKTLTNTNIVLELQRQLVDRRGRQLSLPPLKDGEDCAVWAQSGGGGRVFAAARCPQGLSS